MSVLDKKQDIEQIADALLWDAMGPRMLMHTILPDLNPRDALDEDYKGSIVEWANRLYIANQIAYILTYAHVDDVDRTINMIGDGREWAHGGLLLKDLPRFYLPFGSDEGDGKTPNFRSGMESSLIVMYRSYHQLGRVDFNSP